MLFDLGIFLTCSALPGAFALLLIATQPKRRTA